MSDWRKLNVKNPSFLRTLEGFFTLRRNNWPAQQSRGSAHRLITVPISRARSTLRPGNRNRG